MATTTNYGWTTPDDTALVKDGASAIRSLGTSVDTTTKNLNPSTTLGDIEYRSSTANTNTRLGIGSTGNVLTVAGGVPTWSAPASTGGMTQLGSTTTLSGATTTISSLDPSAYNYLYIEVAGITASANADAYMQINGITSSTYQAWQGGIQGASTVYANAGTRTGFYLMAVGNDALKSTGGNNIYGITITNPNASILKNIFMTCSWEYPSGYYSMLSNCNAQGATSAISSLEFKLVSGTFSGGTVKVYGVK